MLDRTPLTLVGDFARATNPIILAQDCGIVPDPVQAELLTNSANRILLNCCRQWGKSTTTSLIAVHEAVYFPPAMIVLISPSQAQSTELFAKIARARELLPGAPKAEQESLTRMVLANGSRIVSLPGSEKTVRGYSAATMVIMDEAARVPDELLAAVRPMLATTGGRFIAMSTPAGKRGWFYEAWTNGAGWERISIKATECPRISAEFLAAERNDLGPIRFAEEYLCEFLDDTQSIFPRGLIEAALLDDLPAFMPHRRFQPC
jgi:hypothetical protein